MSIIKKIKKIKSQLRMFYHVKIRKDKFMEQIYRWKNDSGDKTLRLNYPLDENSIVVDAGGYLGDFASDISCKYNSYIYVFEPVEEFYKKTKSRFSNNPKVQVIHAGLSDQTAKSSISVDATSSSIYAAGSGNFEQIQLVSISEFIDEYNLTEIDLMKINIEGGEYPLLSSLIESNQLDIVKYYQIQFHNFVPNAEEERNKIRRKLKAKFKLLWDYPFVWESWGKKDNVI